MRPVRLLVSALIAAVALAGVGLSHEAAHAAGSKKLSVYPSDPVKNEQVTYVGHLTTPVARRVVLQYKTKHQGWKYHAETMSEDSGYFTIVRPAARTRTFRFYAPATTVNGTKYAGIKSWSRKVSLATASASISLTPGRQCLGQNKQVLVIATFRPIREHRTVNFTTPIGPILGTQDHQGKVGVALSPGGAAGTFSVSAKTAAFNGAPAKATPAAQFSVLANCP